MVLSILLGILEKEMLTFYNKYKANQFSQNGEDGIIAECLRRLNIETGKCAEWGAHDGLWCSNTAALIKAGWEGLLIEADRGLYESCHALYRHISGVRVLNAVIYKDNVNAFVKYEPDLISMDTDGGNDFHCFKALTSLPKILIIEINSGFPPHEWHVSEEKGASYRAMVELGIEKGYFLLCHTGNLIFVRNEYRDLFPEIEGDGLYNSEMYFNRSWL